MSPVADALRRVRDRVLSGCILTGIPDWAPKQATAALDWALGYTTFAQWLGHVTTGRADVLALLDRTIARAEAE